MAKWVPGTRPLLSLPSWEACAVEHRAINGHLAQRGATKRRQRRSWQLSCPWCHRTSWQRANSQQFFVTNVSYTKLKRNEQWRPSTDGANAIRGRYLLYYWLDNFINRILAISCKWWTKLYNINTMWRKCYSNNQNMMRFNEITRKSDIFTETF